MSLLAGTAATAGGCYGGHFVSWLIAPRHPTKTVKAEYSLEAERLVIVTYAGTDILFSYPTAPLEVSRSIIYEIARNLSRKVKFVVNPAEVVHWQESNLEWPNMTLAQIGRVFQVDTVLYVELERYTMLEERSANLFRGRIKARMQVAKTASDRNPVYETLVETVFPENRPEGVLEGSERQIRAGVTQWFSRDVIRKFHDYEVEVRGGEP